MAADLEICDTRRKFFGMEKLRRTGWWQVEGSFES
jgi:hypothetical protein